MQHISHNPRLYTDGSAGLVHVHNEVVNGDLSIHGLVSQTPVFGIRIHNDMCISRPTSTSLE